MISFPDLLEFLSNLSQEIADCPKDTSPIAFAQALIEVKREIILDSFEPSEIDQIQSPTLPEPCSEQKSSPPPLYIGMPLFSRAEIVLREVNNRLGASQLARLIKERHGIKGTMSSIREALISEMKQAITFGVTVHQETRAVRIKGRDVTLTATFFSIV